MNARTISLDDWMRWDGGPSPVAAGVRVEVIQGGIHLRGIALAFQWRAGKYGVQKWRLERPVKGQG